MFDVIADVFRTYVLEPVAKDPVWLTVIFIGQLIFGSRWITQWIASEYKKKSYVPKIFWQLSLVGGLISMTYFIHIRNPVLIMAFSSSTFIYARNIHLIYRNAKTSPS